MTLTLDRWLKTARRHVRLMATIHAQLEAMDEAWPHIDAAATVAVKSGNGRLNRGCCDEMEAIVRYINEVDRLRLRLTRLQGRMQRHLALAKEAA